MDHTAHIFKSLAEPVRLRILALLFDNEHCVCALMETLELPQSTISRHLAYLKNAGWVEGERRGAWMYYRLAEKQNGLHEQLRQMLVDHLASTKQGASDLSRLQSYLCQKGGNACK